MKKKVLLVIAVLLVFIMMLAGCKKEEPAPAPETLPAQTTSEETETPAETAAETPAEVSSNIGEWSIAIEGVEGVKEFTSADAAGLAAKTVEMTLTNKNGESKTNEYTGVTLKSILDFVGAKDVTSVIVYASDDFSAEYDEKLINADDTLLAWAIDGKPIEGETPIRMCPAQGTGNQFIKNAAKIEVPESTVN